MMASAWRRKYRFVGPPSISLPTNKASAMSPDCSRRSEPLALEGETALRPEGLLELYCCAIVGACGHAGSLTSSGSHDITRQSPLFGCKVYSPMLDCWG